MNRQRKVVITVTYNDLGMIVDTKAEELNLSAQPNLQPTCNQLATDLISRQDAIEAVATVTMSIHLSNVLCDKLLALPSADRPTTDCTKFLEWLKAEVLDEENWELNAVANGEIICRKFRKLGWLDVEDGYYVDTRPTGEWIPVSERLPSKDGCYLVSTTGTNNDIIDIAYYTEEIWHKASRIKAWMPLPEPYKGGDDSE